MPTLRVELPHHQDAQLIKGVGEMLDADVDTILVRPLGRYGYTKSRLYRVLCGEDGLPFVVKTDIPDVVRREAAGIASLQGYYADAFRAKVFRHDGDESPKAIVYLLIHAGDGDAADDIVELRDLAYSGDRATLPTAEMTLRRMYTDLRRVAHRGHFAPVSLAEQYSTYLREDSGRGTPLDKMFGPDGSARRTNIFGLELRDPRRILNAVKSTTIDTLLAQIHGDLHPNNVLVDRDGVPHLIDFAFGHRNGHVVKDFALMECSLRFVVPPRTVDVSELIALDELLLRDFISSEEVASTAGQLDPVADEMLRLTMTVREECASTFEVSKPNSFNFLEFQFAQYLILLGAMRLRSYQDIRALIYLCKLADKIESEH